MDQIEFFDTLVKLEDGFYVALYIFSFSTTW